MDWEGGLKGRETDSTLIWDQVPFLVLYLLASVSATLGLQGFPDRSNALPHLLPDNHFSVKSMMCFLIYGRQAAETVIQAYLWKSNTQKQYYCSCRTMKIAIFEKAKYQSFPYTISTKRVFMPS